MQGQELMSALTPQLSLYRDLLAEIKSRIRAAQNRAALSANAEMILLYWDIGRMIAARQEREGWGAGVIPKLAVDLKNELPKEKGFSERNLKRMLRFFREYPAMAGKVPQPASLLQGDQRLYPAQSESARRIARLGRLGDEKQTPAKLVDRWISECTYGQSKWVLIGGPPCQAYSLVGRARRTREDRETFEKDEKHGLYKEYLRILQKHQPAVFVMENVKGILSAKLGGQPIFGRICEDLSSAGYNLYGLTGLPAQDSVGNWLPESFLVYSENYGIPQARHRVFILGVRNDILVQPRALRPSQTQIDCFDAIRGLPKLWSSVSKRSKDKPDWIKSRRMGLALAECGKAETAKPKNESGARFIEGSFECKLEPDWFHDARIGGVCNHEARSHMAEDISRYAFAAAFAENEGFSPSIHEFPKQLLPNHENVINPGESIPFADRFRVQVKGKPSSTITSHISKDGHYYIHPDPMQARSLTVREAARLQTFPDNYFFEGPRTEQYKQVGNAVPPLLAKQIAEIVAEILENGNETVPVSSTAPC